MAAGRELTAKDIANWLAPSQAVEVLSAVYGTDNNDYLARTTLLGRLAGGMVIAASGQTVIDDSNPPRRVLYGLVPIDDWTGIDTFDLFWTTGDLVCRRIRYGGGGGYGSNESTVRHYGIRFEPEGVRAIIEGAPMRVKEAPELATELPPSNLVETKITTGAPRKDWWDDFWIAICGKIYEGDLKPGRQADLERAMLDWADEHGHSVSEATIRKVAKKLFTAWKLGG